MAYDDERQRLPDVTEQPEYQAAFADRRIKPDERRTKLGIPDELGEDLDALARLFGAGHG